MQSGCISVYRIFRDSTVRADMHWALTCQASVQRSSGLELPLMCWLWTWHVHSLDDPTDSSYWWSSFLSPILQSRMLMLGVNQSWNIRGLHFISSCSKHLSFQISPHGILLFQHAKRELPLIPLFYKGFLWLPNCLFLSRKFLGAQEYSLMIWVWEGLSWHFLFIVTGSFPSYISTTEPVARPNGTQNYK